MFLSKLFISLSCVFISISFIHCTDITNHPNIHLLPVDKCGPIVAGALQRIMFGKEVMVGEYPWMALLVNTDDFGNHNRYCGGTLISKNYVLTAAYCTDGLIPTEVWLGVHTAFDIDVCNGRRCPFPSQHIFISEIVMYKNYKPTKNNIALLRLSKPADLSYPNVQPICLPTKYLDEEIRTEKISSVAGWGLDENKKYPGYLKKATVRVLDVNACKKRFNDFSDNRHPYFRICSEVLSGESCVNDIGGPLQSIYDTGNIRSFVLEGIIAIQNEECTESVYTNVKSYMLWILDNIKE